MSTAETLEKVPANWEVKPNLYEGPYFLECKTYRFRAHSMFDAQLYREKSEVEEWKKKDPISSYVDKLQSEGLLTKKDLDEMENKVIAEVADAVQFAENGHWEALKDLEKYVYSEP